MYRGLLLYYLGKSGECQAMWGGRERVRRPWDAIARPINHLDDMGTSRRIGAQRAQRGGSRHLSSERGRVW